MSHEISQAPDGNWEGMFVGAMPWHGLGTVLKKPPATAADAILAAHMGWPVVKKQLYVGEGEEARAIPGEFAIVREDRWHLREEGAIFGQVSEDYEPLQNIEAFQFFDSLIKEKKACYESAGALFSGKCVWVMARLCRDVEVVKDDTVARYLLLTHRHDGTGAIQVKFTPVRVVCRNTLNQALSEGPSFRVAHRKSMYAQLAKASAALDAVLKQSEKVEAAFRRMAKLTLSTGSLTKYLEAVFPEPAQGDDAKRHEKAVAAIKRNRERSKVLWETGKGNDLPGAQGTLWAAYNGIAEHADYGLTSSRAGKWLESLWFGESYKIKSLAFNTAMRIVNEMRPE
jgi:phage/plasmid-like protein (TIGR03299 family)